MNQVSILLYAIRDAGKEITIVIRPDCTVTASYRNRKYTSEIGDIESSMIAAIIGVMLSEEQI
jgi:hypothetical protein